MDLTNTIIPKSDQMNADDLIAGPRTITITAVEAGSKEQPVIIQYEGANGHPYKPGKSMRRVLVALWGVEGKDYVGKRITVYRDPSVKFGGDAVGGIRISHASGLAEPLAIALTETRGKRKPFRVEPLREDAANQQASMTATATSATDEQVWAWQQIGEDKAKSGLAALQAWHAEMNAGADKNAFAAFWKKCGAVLKVIAEGKA